MRNPSYFQTMSMKIEDGVVDRNRGGEERGALPVASIRSIRPQRCTQAVL
jgi:hypothetical protein